MGVPEHDEAWAMEGWRVCCQRRTDPWGLTRSDQLEYLVHGSRNPQQVRQPLTKRRPGSPQGEGLQEQDETTGTLQGILSSAGSTSPDESSSTQGVNR